MFWVLIIRVPSPVYKRQPHHKKEECIITILEGPNSLCRLTCLFVLENSARAWMWLRGAGLSGVLRKVQGDFYVCS